MPKLFGVEWDEKEEVNTGEYRYIANEWGDELAKKNLDPYGLWDWEEVNEVIIGGPTKTILNNNNRYTVEIREDKTVLYEMTPDTENDVDFSS